MQYVGRKCIKAAVYRSEYVSVFLCVCMYVRMHLLCMYVCMYVCACVCTDKHIYVSIYVYPNMSYGSKKFVCMYVWTCACMYVCMYVCMHVCVYVCTYLTSSAKIRSTRKWSLGNADSAIECCSHLQPLG